MNFKDVCYYLCKSKRAVSDQLTALLPWRMEVKMTYWGTKLLHRAMRLKGASQPLLRILSEKIRLINRSVNPYINVIFFSCSD
ncbi:hypothetical protein [Chitinophaga pinensis]|uniref:Uncharacterized protein n=1 Tax=Chitinophaga pinensis (strain ATCC 43595 / DSM 2588 / LMG 13176 / NBRC 15968 / NCIMB 11800 / UQM 2034) TaxID=485918 RepID=A0A979G5N2_CHIPD|nr:hypothetical protein [Chitinophaga pinensis]ACU61261.1 hypothetical protein Cpin_3799 [Chitinophaga pinensis DSM 2588]